MRTFSYSAQGPRDYQQDRLLIQELPGIDKMAARLAIADGMGGYKNGDWAAELCIETLKNDPNTVRAFKKANQVCKSFHDRRGSTLIAVEVANLTARVYWAGDSRLYHIRDWETIYVTQDHQLPDSHGGGLLNAISFLHDVEMKELDLQNGDTLVLTSDGIDILTREEIAGQLNDPDPAKSLVELALKKGSGDNCTAIVAVIGE